MILPGDLDGAPVADALLAHLGSGETLHAVRPAAPFYLLSIPAEVAQQPAVALALHHRAAPRGEHYEVPAGLAGPLVAAIASDDNNTLAAIAASAIKKEEN